MYSPKNEEYLFQMIFIFRKTIPSNTLFYAIFFLLKFIGIHLITHDLKGLESTTYTLNRLFRTLTLLSANLSFITGTYEVISFIIFAFLIIMLISFGFLLLRFRTLSSKTKKIIQLKNYEKPFDTNRLDMLALKVLSVLMLVVLLISQHISEVLLFSLIPFLTTKSPLPQSQSAKDQLELFIFKLYLNHYILLAMNIVSIVVLSGFLYLFLFFASSLSIITQNGFNLNLGHFYIIAMVIIFNAQGFHSISNYALTDQSITMKFILCIVVLGLLLRVFTSSVKQYNHSQNRLCFFINVMLTMCLLSGITEVILYFTRSSDLHEVDSFFKALLIVLNAFFINCIIVSTKKRAYLSRFFKNIFSKNSKQSYESIEEFCDLIANRINSHDDFIEIIQIFEAHRFKSTSDSYQCHKHFKGKAYANKDILGKSVMRLFESIAEGEIISLINKAKERNLKHYQVKLLYFLHVDFILTVKKNHFMALYLSKWYQESKAAVLDFFTRYLFYEIQEDVLGSSSNKKSVFSGKIGINSSSHRQSGFSRNYKQIRLLQLQEFSSNMLLSISECLTELEKFISFKTITRMGIKSTFTSEHFINTIMTYISKYELMVSILDSFLEENECIPIFSIELSYVLHYFFVLFKGSIPEKYQGKITLLPQYDDYLSFNLKNDKFLIASLSKEDKTIIDYVSIRIVDELGFAIEELKGSDLHEKLIPAYLSSYHFIYLKAFILQGHMKMKKNCFVLNKLKHLVLYNISSRALPSFTRRLSLISKIKNNKGEDLIQKDKIISMMYYFCIDYSFNFLATSNYFTKHFLFPLPMLQTLQLSLCSFFGLRSDAITSHFNARLNKKKSAKGREIMNSILDTIPKEKEQDYKNVLDHFTIDTEPIEKCFTISKYKLINSLKGIEKSIEELGLESHWKESIAGLQSKVTQGIQGVGNEKAITNFSSMITATQHIADDSYRFLFKLKHIGNLYYYIVLLSDEIKDKTPTILLELEGPANETPKRRNSNATSVASTKPNPADGKKKSLFVSFNDSSFNDLLERKNLNQSMNTSKNILLNSNHVVGEGSPISKYDMSLNFSEVNPAVIQGKLDKAERQLKIFRRLQMLFFFLLMSINIISFIVNSSIISLFQALFKLNVYGFLLYSEVLFASLGCLRSCLIQDRYQTGSIETFQEKVYDHSSQMLNHLQQFQIQLHNLQDASKGERLYTILLDRVEYQVLMPNWSISSRNSSLLEELYYLHYYLSNFDLTTSKSCRLDFFLKGIDQSNKDIDSNKEERAVYYIITNTIGKISLSLYKLTEVTFYQLDEYGVTSDFNMTLWNSLLLVIAFCSFLLQILYTFRLKYVFGYLMRRFFYKDIREDEFNKDVNRLKSLIANFGKQECSYFEGTSLYKTQQALNSNQSFYLQIHSDGRDKQSSLVSKHNPHNIKCNREFPTQSPQNEKSRKGKYSKNCNKFIDEAKTAKSQLEYETNSNFNREVNKLTRLKFMTFFFVMLFFLFFAFIILQMGCLFFSSRSSADIKQENVFTLFYLLRLPKFAELILYSEITVLTNNLTSIDPKEMNFTIENVFNIAIDTGDSLLNSLENHYYIDLFNQLFLIRGSLIALFSDASKAHMFPLMLEVDRSFQGEDFCVSIGPSLMITQLDGQVDSWVTFYSEANKESKQCRMIGNEINLSGLKVVFDYLVQSLNVLYIDFERNRLHSLTAQTDFLQDNILELLVDEIQTTFSSVNIVFAYNIIKDMENNYSKKYNSENLLSIVTMIFSCGAIIILSLVIWRTFARYNRILSEFWQRFDQTLALKLK